MTIGCCGTWTELLTLADRVANEEFARKGVVKPDMTVVIDGRLSMFGHVKSRKGEGLLGDVTELEVPMKRPKRRPGKQWENKLEED